MTSAAIEPLGEPFVTDDGLIHYPFPLSTGQVATLLLPHDLSRDDAERLADYFQALAVKP